MTLSTPTIQDETVAGDAEGVVERRRSRWHLLVLAIIAYVPLLYTHPGWIAADTKAYLYLDPVRLTRSARYLWNPNVGMGTVTHQNIGYLFPMGPWYWAFHLLGVPTWIAQRLWMGTLLFAAATGVRYLGRQLGLSTWGQLAAALPYMLTPFVIDYLARTSAILMPWAGLGWLVGFMIVAVRRGGWRYPALFALVVALIGGVNATSVLLVGLAPLLWLVLAGLSKEASWRRVGAATLRAGVLSAVVSLWWVAGLWAEGAYGINVLRYTETFPTVTMTSLASEVLRGLGYWYFYGNDKIQPWTLASSSYMSHTFGVLVSFALPALALAGVALVRWRYRAFAALLIVGGVVLAVGAYPLSNPTPVGTVLRSIGENSTIGLAMRSSNRVIPLVVLGLSLLLGAVVTSLRSWRTAAPMVASILVGVLACVNLAPLFQGQIVATNLMFPETLPGYVTSAAKYLNAKSSLPVLGIPGIDFGYYRWGVTEDAVWPGLLTRPYIQRQAVLQGTPPSANLLRALDESIQDGTLDPATLVPMAQLMGVSNVLLQSDVQYERFDTPRPQALWLALRPAPKGLHFERGFGPSRPTVTLVGPILDETQLSMPTGASYPPRLAVYSVDDPRGLLRTESMQNPILLAGDGQGVVLAAGAGLLNGKPRGIVYAASRTNKEIRLLAAAPRAELVLTDTNAKELDTWGTLHTTYGYVEQAGEQPVAYNPAEQSLPIFANQSPATQTVLRLSGIKSVRASGYGNPVANAPEAQPLNAVDGDLRTAWTVGAFSDPRGQFISIGLAHPTTMSKVLLRQPQLGVRSRWITKATLGFSDGSHVVVRLSPSSRTTGQTFHFSPRRTSSLSVTIDDMTGSHTDFSGSSAVGFATIAASGIGPVSASLRLPKDLLAAAGSASANDTLVILMHRLRAATVPPRTDPELSMSRTFSLPAPRSFTVGGTARLSTLVPDRVINTLVGRGPGTGNHVTSTNSSTTLTGSLTNGSWSAFDGDLRTSWSPAFLAPLPPWISATLSSSTSLNQVTLQIVNDGRHSLPTSVRVTSNTGQVETATIPALKVPSLHVSQGRTVAVTVHFPAVSGHIFRFAFPSIRSVTTVDHVSGLPIALPVGIAEVEMPNVTPGTTPEALPRHCLGGLLYVDGVNVPVRITGATSNALQQRAATVTGCGAPIVLSSGTHSVTTAPGYRAGWNLDTLELRSPRTVFAGRVEKTAQVMGAHWTNQVSLTATLSKQSVPSWLVLNQSFSTGWQATIDGRDLGTPKLLDGGFTAWQLPPTRQGAKVAITWAPQQTVDVALLLSLLGLLLVAACIVYGARRRRDPEAPAERDLAPNLSWPWQERARPSLPLAAGAVVVSMAIAGPAVALVLVPLLALTWWRPTLRAGLALGPAALLGLAGLYVIDQQRKFGWPHNIQWPTHFGFANTLAWVALSLLLVDVAAYGLGGPIASLLPATADSSNEPPVDDATSPPPPDGLGPTATPGTATTTTVAMTSAAATVLAAPPPPSSPEESVASDDVSTADETETEAEEPPADASGSDELEAPPRAGADAVSGSPIATPSAGRGRPRLRPARALGAAGLLSRLRKSDVPPADHSATVPAPEVETTPEGEAQAAAVAAVGAAVAATAMSADEPATSGTAVEEEVSADESTAEDSAPAALPTTEDAVADEAGASDAVGVAADGAIEGAATAAAIAADEPDAEVIPAQETAPVGAAAVQVETTAGETSPENEAGPESETATASEPEETPVDEETPELETAAEEATTAAELATAIDSVPPTDAAPTDDSVADESVADDVTAVEETTPEGESAPATETPTAEGGAPATEPALEGEASSPDSVLDAPLAPVLPTAPAGIESGTGLARVRPAKAIGAGGFFSRFRRSDDEEEDQESQMIALPASGIARSRALLKAFRKEQQDPDLFYRTLALDTLHRLTGTAPLFNRTVIDVGGGAGYFAEAFRDAGARVVLVEPEAADPIPAPLTEADAELDPVARHKRAVWPGRLLPGDTLAGDGLSLPLPDGVADLVFSSNVLEHVPDPARFIDEAIRVTKPGGLLYLSFTLWWSPWGGHETSPWHFISGRYALRRYTKRHKHPPKNVFGESLFALNAGTALKLVKHRDDVELLVAEPRYYPVWARWIVRVPFLRELATWNLVMILEKL